jgi:aminopeptidase N
MKRSFLLLSFLLLIAHQSGYAQLLHNSPQKFTRADTLRGTLSPERICYDVLYYHLNIDVNINDRYISGSNVIRFKAMNDFVKMQVDLFENMKVERIMYKEKELAFKRESNAVFITFPEKIKKGTTTEFKFFYSGNPIVAKKAPWDGGFVFQKDKDGNPWVGVAVQGTGASLWWPNKDHQSDEPDSMMISITIPSGLMNISNGRLRSKEELNGKTKYNWFVKNPINNYDVTLNIGKYFHFDDVYTNADGEKLTLDYYVLPQNADIAKKQFEEVKPMLKIFEKHFGKYPFYEDGFKLVETSYLGMEHQSCIAYGNEYKKGYKGLDLSGTGEGLKFDYIIIHEAAHEWWGNSVTSEDIADMWLHEGFGQYSETVYLEDLYGKESALTYLNGLKGNVGNKTPVIGPYGVNEEGSGDMYPKGALMLNTLRSVVNNDTLWWNIVKGIQAQYRHRATNTNEIIAYVNKMSGKDLTPVFDQYLRYPAIPVLELKYTQKGNDVELEYRWKADVKKFNMPVDLILKNSEVIRIYPGNDFTKTTLKNSMKEDVKVDTRRFYVKVS